MERYSIKLVEIDRETRYMKSEHIQVATRKKRFMNYDIGFGSRIKNVRSSPSSKTS